MSEDTQYSTTETPGVHGQDGLLAPKVATLSKAMMRAAQLHARSRFGLSQMEWQIVMLLAVFQPVAIRRLADIAMADAAQISRAVAALARKQLVERGTSARDGRQAALSLTQQGTDIALLLRQLSWQRNARLLEGFSPQQTAGLFDMLDVLIARAMREETDNTDRGADSEQE